MKFYNYLFFLFSLAFCSAAQAQSILPNIADSIGSSAVNNIIKAERVFCYNVSTKAKDYEGYTLDNAAIEGFCGVVDENLKDMLIEQLLATETNFDFDHTENCTIQPQILLRFFRGVDSTDIMLSSPCYSISVFYGGSVKTFNMKPATELLDTIVKAFDAKDTTFVSPALLNQLLPIGIPKTSAQKPSLSQDSQPKRGWDNSSGQSPSKSNSGWNSLKF